MDQSESEYFNIDNCYKDFLNPDFIRFYRPLFSDADIEVEFLRGNEKQGKIVDIAPQELEKKLVAWGYEMTKNLYLALSVMQNLGHVVYMPKYDAFVT
jgi:hypothetical protein